MRNTRATWLPLRATKGGRRTAAVFRDDLGDDPLTARIRDEQFLQAPRADAMTDVGQLAFLRRLYGAPIPSENFIFAMTKEVLPTVT